MGHLGAAKGNGRNVWFLHIQGKCSTADLHTQPETIKNQMAVEVGCSVLYTLGSPLSWQWKSDVVFCIH